MQLRWPVPSALLLLLLLAPLRAEEVVYPVTLDWPALERGVLRVEGQRVELALTDAQGRVRVRAGSLRPQGALLQADLEVGAGMLHALGQGEDAVPERLRLSFPEGGARVVGGLRRGAGLELGLRGERPPAPAPRLGQILVVVSAAREIPVTDLATGERRTHTTGFFLGELSYPLLALEAAGWEPVFATPGGVAPTLDRDSLRSVYWTNGGKAEALRLLARHAKALERPRALADLDEWALGGFGLLLVPGGHAPMADLVADPDMARVLRHFHEAGKPTGMICHAPVALLSTLRPGETWPYADYRMTAVSDAEEHTGERLFLRGRVDWYPARRLAEGGAQVSGASLASLLFASHMIEDRELITAQNPWAGIRFGRALVAAAARWRQSGSLRAQAE